MRLKKGKEAVIFHSIAYLFIILFAVFCVIPFIMLVSGSFSTESEVVAKGYSLIPRKPTLYPYRLIFMNPRIILNAYAVSVIVTLGGTLLSLLTMSMTAYALARKDFRFRNGITFFFYFTTLFYGGLLPYYILVVRYLHLKNNLLVLILPGLINVFNLLIIKNFIARDVPDSLPESARIDGAGDFRIYLSIVLPLMKPALAAIGLFTVIMYWNDWYNSMLFIEKPQLYNLQYTLYNLLNKLQFLKTNVLARTHVKFTTDLPLETIKLSMTVVAVGPIIFIYPFLQKYFVKGITIGAVKG